MTPGQRSFYFWSPSQRGYPLTLGSLLKLMTRRVVRDYSKQRGRRRGHRRSAPARLTSNVPSGPVFSLVTTVIVIRPRWPHANIHVGRPGRTSDIDRQISRPVCGLEPGSPAIRGAGSAAAHHGPSRSGQYLRIGRDNGARISRGGEARPLAPV